MTALRPRDADQLAAFARAARPVAVRAVALTAGGTPQEHADRLVDHWRREAVLLTGLSGLGGRLASAAQDAVSTAVQASLVVCLCEAAGMHELRAQVRVLAAAVLDAQLPPSWAPTGDEGEATDAEGETVRARLVEMGRRVWAVRRVTQGRRDGRLWHRGVAMLPVLGAAGAVLGERHALVAVATRAAAEIAAAREASS